jgi:hypothetical protein
MNLPLDLLLNLRSIVVSTNLVLGVHHFRVDLLARLLRLGFLRRLRRCLLAIIFLGAVVGS